MSETNKQSWERYPIAGSILNVQTPTETVSLANSSASAVDNTGADATSIILDDTQEKLDTDPDSPAGYTNNMYSIRLQAGDENDSPYVVTFYLETSEGNRYECEMIVNIEELEG